MQTFKSGIGAEHGFYAQFNKIANIRNVVVCYIDHQPVGCGAFKEYDQKSVEIKRMFVKPEYRNQGLGLEILKELEMWASELKYSAAILETGKKQPEGNFVVSKGRYRIIKNFGQYEDVENRLGRYLTKGSFRFQKSMSNMTIIRNDYLMIVMQDGILHD